MCLVKKVASLAAASVMCVCVFGAEAQKSAVSAAGTTIVNDTFWKDTSGKNIYSQGGGVFKFGDTYYWYGVHYKGAETYAANPSKKNDDTGFVSVTCYSSKDLVNWKFENDVLTSKSKGMKSPYWFGRLGVAYCKKTKMYVLIAQHNEDVMFAQCSTPAGNYEVKNYQNQIDGVLKAGTGDQTVFTDDDGNSYIICSNKGGRAHQYVVPLNSDYLSAGKAVEISKGSGREGNCMFKYKGKYYFCASDLHGWNSSHSYYTVADNIMGPYSAWKVMPGTDADFSHVTQTGFFYTVKGSKQETVLFCGDRWSDFAGNGLGYNQWVPLSFNGSEPYFNSLSEWNLNDDTGEWTVGSGNNYILNPSFEADRVSQATLAGWKASGTGNSNKNSARTGRWSAQQWSDKDYKATLSQDISLPDGKYTLKFWARSSGGQKDCKVYLNSNGNEYKSSLNKSLGSWTEFTINDIEVKGGKCQVGIYSDAKAGNYVYIDDFSLVGNGQSAPAVIQPDPVPDGKYVKSLDVKDTDNYSDWSVQSDLQEGKEVFGDRAFKFTRVPEILKGAEFIRTACDSKKYSGTQATFKAGEDISVFLALDNRITETPEWLKTWNKTDMIIDIDGDPAVTFNLYKADVKKGDTVTLGVEGVANSVNYIVAATLPVTYPVAGDVTADGLFNSADVIALNKWFSGISDPETTDLNAADINKDGKINIADLCLLKSLLCN